jgi:hypothetical protein
MSKHPFEYQPPTEVQIETIQVFRAFFKALYDLAVEHLPPTRERALAFTNLQQASMWMNAAVVFEDTGRTVGT